jgi:hypothetical protein
VAGHLSFQLRNELPGGRRDLRMTVGPFSVAVTETPGSTLTQGELDDLNLARRSYADRHEGDGQRFDDPLDRVETDVQDVCHYRAWVTDDSGAGLVTMRRVRVDLARQTGEPAEPGGPQLPPELRFWRAQMADSSQIPLWQLVRGHVRSLFAMGEPAALPVAAVGRIAVWARGEADRDRDRTAVALAATQLLAAERDVSLLYVWSLRPELRDRVVGIRLADLHAHSAFTPTEVQLGLPGGAVHIDDSLGEVRAHQAEFPGYWLDNAGAAEVIAELLDEGRVSVDDCAAAIMRAQQAAILRDDRRLLCELARATGGDDHRRLAEILTRPHVFGYLASLMTDCARLAGMTGGELCQLLGRVGAGPGSAAVRPAAWIQSAWGVLETAAAKYGPLGAPRRAAAVEEGFAIEMRADRRESGGVEHDEWRTVDAATIETVIGRMDQRRHTEASLRDGDRHLVVGGGDGAYVVCVANQATGASVQLVEPDAAEGETVEVVAGGQLGRYPSRHVVGRQAALRAARHFAETGQRDPALRWHEAESD